MTAFLNKAPFPNTTGTNSLWSSAHLHHTSSIYKPEYSGSEIPVPLPEHAYTTWWQNPRTLPQSGSLADVLTESDP